MKVVFRHIMLNKNDFKDNFHIMFYQERNTLNDFKDNFHIDNFHTVLRRQFSLYVLHQCTYRFIRMLSIAFFFD